MERDSDRARAARAARRGTWPIRRYALGEEPDDDLNGQTTAAQRVGMMWQLAKDAWASTGRPLPSYTRAEMPGRIIRGRDDTGA